MRAGSPQRELRRQTHRDQVLLAAAETEEPGAEDGNPTDLMTKHLDGKHLVMLCELLDIKHIDGRPSSAPLTLSASRGLHEPWRR